MIQIHAKTTGRKAPRGLFTLSPTQMRAIGMRQLRRNLERVEQRGRDVNEAPFAPYSKKGPYYYYPQAAHRKTTSKQRRSAAKRLAGILRKGGAKSISVTSGGGIRFPSYAAFKRSLGRSVVDLAGPHRRMLSRVIVGEAKPDRVTISVLGAEAARAQGHQEGNPKMKLPRRKWLGFSPKERTEVTADIVQALRSAAKEKA